MSDWNAGYITEIEYTYGCYAELNPLRARFALLYAGLTAPETHTACELGFGQGMSVNLHAAGSPVKWWGTDFNPSQALFAQQLATASESGAQLADQSFSEFCSRTDLPEFDYIGLHGIWSWIADEHRAQIVDFVRRKLKVGGVLFISYNVLPGWSQYAPLRHLFAQHSAVMSASGQGIVPRVDAALAFTRQLLETKPAYARAVSGVMKRLKNLEGNDRHYLAHEYLNHHWVPMYFAEIAQWLEQAKVSFGCSAIYTDLVPAVNLTVEQQDMLDEIPDPGFRETVRDFMTNVQFRRDYWIKGARRLHPLERGEMLRKQRVMLVTPREDVSLKIVGSVSEMAMDENLNNPILDLLADHQPRTIGSLEMAVRDKDIDFTKLLRAIVLLLAKNDLALVQDDDDIVRAKPHADKLNANLLERVRSGGETSFLTSPVTGGGIQVRPLEQLLLLAHRQGHAARDELVQSVLQVQQALGRKVHVGGKQLDSDEDNLVALQNIAESFLTKRLPIFKTLQLI
jgi:SAM-dependent methyltransferase